MAKKTLPAAHASTMDVETRTFLALVLIFLTVCVYFPAFQAGYIYDDDQLLTQNQAIQRGRGFLDLESWRGLASLWFPTDINISADYFPLTSSTLWFEWRLWGNNEPGTPPESLGIGAPGYHITNILLHAACAFLLWRVLEKLRVPGAWIAALVWAVHPVCVESVAWIAERKNTLSMFLFLLAMLAWIRYIDSNQRRDYLVTLGWFTAALLAKTAIVMVPFVLLLTVWWKRGKITVDNLKESIPFFVLSFILGVVTLHFQYSRAIGEEYIPIGGPFDRLAGACFALGFYLWKIVWPFELSLIYPQWHETIPKVLQLLCVVPFLVVFPWAWRRRDGWGKHALFGVGFFVITLAPILGLLKMAYMRLTLVADHFQYTPMVGVIALGVAGLTEWHRKLDAMRRNTLATLGALLIAMLCWLTWHQAGLYKDKQTIWTDTLRKNPNSWQANNHLGAVLYGQGDVDTAMYHFKRGVDLKPYNPEVHNNYALALSRKGRMDEALVHYKRAVDIKDVPSIRMNYANALFMVKRYDEAAANYREILKDNPNDRFAALNLVQSLMHAKRYSEAIMILRSMLKANPKDRDAQQLLEHALREQKALEQKQ